MPAVWQKDSFVRGGLSGIEEFVGRLREVEEDVESTFDNKTRMQMALHFYDVDPETIISADPVTLEDGRYTTWVGQSSRVGSTNQRMFDDWYEFFTSSGLTGELPSAFYDMLIRWRKATYEMNNGMNPGRAFVPVEIIEEEEQPKKKTSAKKTSAKKTKAEPEPEPEEADETLEPDKSVVDTVLTAIGEDGATRDIIRRAVVKTAAMRNKVSAAGGLDTVLVYCVDHGYIVESEGFYYLPDEEPV